MYRKSWIEQHPLLAAVGVILAAATVGAYWYVLLPVGALAAVMWFGTIRYDRAFQDRRIRREQLAAHADYEQRMWDLGSPVGVFGQYPPHI